MRVWEPQSSSQQPNLLPVVNTQAQLEMSIKFTSFPTAVLVPPQALLTILDSPLNKAGKIKVVDMITAAAAAADATLLLTAVPVLPVAAVWWWASCAGCSHSCS
jgi:hypothetical protein